MKTIKTIVVFLFSLLLTFNAFAENNDVSIIDIDSKNSNILKIFFDKDIETNNQNVTSDVKIFKDLNNKKISIDLKNNKLVHLSLEKVLEANTSYSLLSVYWAEWAIDFKLDDIVNPIEINWASSDWIEKLIISDSQNIEIYFKEAISSDSVDLKLLREYDTESLKINSENKKELDIYLKDELYNNSNYIAMIFSITTKEEFNYTISNSIYDFTTKSVSIEKVEVPSEGELDWKSTWDIALNSANTPETWAETWILILTTLLVSNFVYFRKKILKN